MTVQGARDPMSSADSISHWRPQDFAAVPVIDPIGPGDVRPILPDLDLWDCWPLQHEDGRTVVHAGRQWWFFLSSPKLADPEERHHQARIRLASLGEEGWRDHGDVLDPATSPGSREWAGSAVLFDDGRTCILHFTAAGRNGGPFSFEQRLFAARGELGAAGPCGFGVPEEIIVADERRYVRVTQADGHAGTVKAFRDPAWFRDPATGLSHILFTASAAWSGDAFNGVVGSATWRDGAWSLDHPLVDAIGVNNELERPCVVVRDGLYYLFWSTQRHTFADPASAGPNGLYGMVAEALAGPWKPLNGNGLVAANPASTPAQAYSWWVTGEGDVRGFVNYWGTGENAMTATPEFRRAHFGGTPSPAFRLRFDGDRVEIAQPK
ncbi:MAG: glycoside hydrolase family 68 protein [Sphingomonadales bacterium]|nr:glycoside hydrolase family 68 protein [Sphingomonadales bacterium]MDE2569133.1 glycoside hydrolase family 68 protein [Sphingomonadales bacterium]